MDNIPRHLWLRPPAGELIDEVMCCRERGGYLLTLHGGPAIRRAVERELHTAGFSAGQCHPFGEGVFAARTLSLLPEARGAAAVGLVLEAAGQVDALRAALDEPSAIPSLLEDSSNARFLFNPPRVQLWGPVNAGKSSLLNGLCERELAATGAEPGLTRDVIEGRFEHQGFEIRLFDAPGVWSGGGALDADAQRLAEVWRGQADLTVHLCPPGREAAPVADGWLLHSMADQDPAAPEPRISLYNAASLAAFKDRLIEHFFGPLRRLPPQRRFALHPQLREDLGNSPHAARGWLD
ncbi:MAG: 50S ribosome-binding GTPase [Planctomycetes bacterium]|nr:50S ribosome-binding GTPase [Planctomycetota bacterium]